jgi:hypothetical protein
MIAPDTTGLNFFRADPSLADLLALYLPAALWRHVEPGIHAMSHRPGLLGWPETYPSVAKHAFTSLFNQAEFGLGCPINVTAGAAMLLARPEGAPAGTRGVGLFLMPRRLDDGTPNRYRIVRLKDKLGTRSMASGEIVLEGALAYGVGPLDRGFVQMAEMVTAP